MASVWCRCGHSCRVPEGVPRASGTSGSSGAASRSSTSSRRPEDRADHAGGLGQHRRAGGVEDHPAGPDAVERRCRAARCWSGTRSSRSSAVRRHRASGRRRRAPRPEHGASTSTRSKRPGGHGGPGAVGRDHAQRRPSAPASARATRPARCGCSSAASSPAPARPRDAASRAALPPGPAQRSSQRSSRPRPPPAPGASATSWEPSSWTPARPSATAGTDAGVAALQHHAVRREAGARAPGSSSTSARPGPRHQDHARGHVVGGEQGVELRPPPPPRSAAPRPSAGGCGRPRRTRSGRVDGSGATRRTQPARSCSATRRSTALAKPGRALPDPCRAPGRRWC